MKDIFSKKLITARKSAGLSLEELSERSDISKQTLSKYEIGQVAPTGTSIIKLCEALNVTPDYLLSESLQTDSLKNIHFREEQKHDTHEIKNVKTITLQKIENYFQLERLANEIIEFKNPIEDIFIKNKLDAKKAANTLRKRWKLGNEPIRNVVDTLESKGVKIIELQFSSSFEGLSGNFKNVPIIVINLSISEITRRRFTILHELGHLILNIDKNILEDEDLIEHICDSFAGAILLPEEIIITEFKNRTKISMTELIDMKKKYGASIQAILIRAADMKLIPWSEFREYKEEGSIFNTGSYEINDKSERLLRLVWKCLSEEKITPSKASNLTGMSPSQLKEHLNFITF